MEAIKFSNHSGLLAREIRRSFSHFPPAAHIQQCEKGVPAIGCITISIGRIVRPGLAAGAVGRPRREIVNCQENDQRQHTHQDVHGEMIGPPHPCF